MPILKHDRNQRFDQAIAAGMSQTQAYIYRPESGQSDQQSEPFSAGSLPFRGTCKPAIGFDYQELCLGGPGQ